MNAPIGNRPSRPMAYCHRNIALLLFQAHQKEGFILVYARRTLGEPEN
jgi:hypothetical protein